MLCPIAKTGLAHSPATKAITSSAILLQSWIEGG